MRDGLPTLPRHMKNLPLDARGYPIPWFTHVDKAGVPDFRIIGAGKHELALKWNSCWICGTILGSHKAFITGPLSTISRLSAEPPSHYDCALFAACACPFLTRPKATYRETPAEGVEVIPMAPENPGVTCLWITSKFRKLKDQTLYIMGEPTRVEWYREGKRAGRTDVLRAFEAGMPALQNDAVQKGLGHLTELRRRYDQALALVPAYDLAPALGAFPGGGA